MTSTFEISYYPLLPDYKGPIKDFINALKDYDGLMVHTTCMSTYIKGDFKLIMEALTVELDKVHQIIPASATIMKIIPQDLDTGVFLSI